MKFYDCSTAPSPRRVRIFIAEKNIDVETIEVNLMKGEHLTPEYRAKNPNLEVPLLELENGTTIAQANAICRYLEDIKPENPLHGRDSIESALVDGANTKIMLDGFMAAAEAFRNSTPGMKNRAMPGPHNFPKYLSLLSVACYVWIIFSLISRSILSQMNTWLMITFQLRILVLSFVSILQSG